MAVPITNNRIQMDLNKLSENFDHVHGELIKTPRMDILYDSDSASVSTNTSPSSSFSVCSSSPSSHTRSNLNVIKELEFENLDDDEACFSFESEDDSDFYDGEEEIFEWKSNEDSNFDNYDFQLYEYESVVLSPSNKYNVKKIKVNSKEPSKVTNTQLISDSNFKLIAQLIPDEKLQLFHSRLDQINSEYATDNKNSSMTHSEINNKCLNVILSFITES